jgi:TPR repeat protein
MALLANEYDSGIWLKANPKQAKQLRQQAAKQGSVLAQWELGL